MHIEHIIELLRVSGYLKEAAYLAALRSQA